MRYAIALGGLAAVLLVGTGCRSHVAGRCDCENHPEAAVVPAPAANYPVIGGAAPVTAAPTSTIAPNGAMGGAAPMAMPAPEKLPK